MENLTPIPFQLTSGKIYHSTMRIKTHSFQNAWEAHTSCSATVFDIYWVLAMCWGLSGVVKHPKIPFCKKRKKKKVGGESELEHLVMLINHILNWSYKAASKKECLILKENRAGQPQGVLRKYLCGSPANPLDRCGLCWLPDLTYLGPNGP